MSNILKTIDLTDHAIRRAVFAVLYRLAAEHRANRKGSERMQERDAKRRGTRPTGSSRPGFSAADLIKARGFRVG
jgi:hypothetical protein